MDWKTNTAQRTVQATEAECQLPSVPMEGQAVIMPLAGMLSSKKRSRQLKTPFDASQTEYVKIPSAVKRPCVEAMTDRQKEVLARQKAGRSHTFCIMLVMQCLNQTCLFAKSQVHTGSGRAYILCSSFTSW